MVKMAKAKPLKFIGLVVAFFVLYLLSGTNLFSLPATGEGAAGAVQYTHLDTPTNIKAGQPFEIRLGLMDQTGKPVSGKAYGTDFGSFFVPTDGIKNAHGEVPRFNIDTAGVKEIRDAQGNGTGIYRIPTTISSWAENATSNVYTVEAHYVGASQGSPDNSSNTAYYLTASTTFTAEADGAQGVVKYAVSEVDKVTLTVAEVKPNEPPPSPKANTLTFRVKLVAQTPFEDGKRAFHGLDAPGELSKWLPPHAVDNTGKLLNVSYGSIIEEVSEFRGTKHPTGIYRVQINLESPAELAGRRAAIRFGFQDSGVALSLGSTVNFTAVGKEAVAVKNPFFANPNLIEQPHSPETSEVDFPDLLDPDNATNGATAAVLIAYVDNWATAGTPNVAAAEYFIDTVGAEGSGTPMAAYDGSYNSPSEYVTATLSTALLQSLTENQHTVYVRGKDTTGAWGPTSYTTMLIDRTAPTIAVTKPVANEFVPSTTQYRVEGTTTNPGGTGATTWSAIDRVEVYEESQTGWLTGLNDVSRGGVNFSAWYYQDVDHWNTTAIADGPYTLRTRAYDTAGNVSSEATVGVAIDNTEPISDIDSPLGGVGFNTTTVSTVTVTGTASDTNIDNWKLEYGVGEKSASDTTGWILINSGTSNVSANTLGTWNISSLSEGAYTLKLTTKDKAGNYNLDNQPGQPSRIFVYIDNTPPTAAISSPTSGWVGKSVTITGTAADTGVPAGNSGVKKAEIRIQRGDNLQYWTGSGWGTEPTDWPDATITSGAGTPNANWQYVFDSSSLPNGTNVTIWAKATDDADNTGSPSTSVTVQCDTAAPVTTRARTIEPAATTWYNFATGTPTITLSATDTGGSGVSAIYYRWDGNPYQAYTVGFGTPGEGTHTLNFYALDATGNVETAQAETYKIDTVKPGSPAGTPPPMTAEPTYTQGLSNSVAWTAITDTAPSSGTISYYAEYDDDSLFGSPNGNSGWITTTSTTFSGLTDATKYYYRVKAKDPAGNETTSFSASTFSTQDNTAPSTTHALGGTLGLNNWYISNVTVTLTPSDATSGVQNTKYKVSFNGGAFGADTVGTSYTATNDGTYDIQYWSTDNVNNIESTKTIPQFKKDATLPTSVITSPVADNAYVRATVSITGTSSDATSLVNKVEVAFKNSVGNYYNGIGWTGTSPTWFAATGTTSWSYDWNTVATGATDGQYTIYSKATDNAGNATSVSPWDGARVVNVDNTNPQVSSTDPGNNATLVATNTTVKAYFNEKMSSSTINATTFKLQYGSPATDVPGMVTYTEEGASYYATFTPTSALSRNVTYTATITTGAQDLAGNGLSTGYAWSFTTANIEAELWLPANNAYIYGTIPIVGIARGDSPGVLNEYKLEYGAGTNPSSWTLIGTVHTSDVTSGSWSQTDWSGGATGGGSPAVVTGTTNQYWQSSNLSVTPAGEVRLNAVTSWPYRKPITIDNTGGSALSNYQVKVDVSYVAGKMNADFSDLRFTDSDGTTLLDYWIESYTASTSAIVWVKVPSISASSSKTIYMYYGNSGATSLSDGEAVFSDFFDDFSGTSIDATKWTEVDTAANYITQSGDTLNVSGGPGSWGSTGLYSTTNFSRPFIFEIAHKRTGGNYAMLGIKDTTTGISYTDFVYAGYPIYDGGGNRLAVYEDGSNRGDNKKAISSGVWQYYKFEVLSTGANYYHGGSPQAYTQYYNSTYSTEAPLKIGFPNYNQVFQLDNARVRKYASPEPSTSVGAEDASNPLVETYVSSGSLTSSVFDAGAAKNWGAIFWTQSVPAGTKMTFQVRTNTTPGDSNPEDGGWSSWSAPMSVATGEQLPSASAQYIQYKVNLYSNSDNTKAPVLYDVTLYHTLLETWNTASLTDGVYTLRLSVKNSANPYDYDSPSKNAIKAKVVVNVQNHSVPTSTITFPITDPDPSSYVKGTVNVTGTSSDDFPGVSKVEVRIKRNSDGLYWSGSGNNWGISAWLLTTDSEGSAQYRNWTYSWNTKLLDGVTKVFGDGAYTVESKATDKANEPQTAYSSITVTVDNTVPTGSVTFPTGGGFVAGGYVGISGSAADSNFKEYKVEYGAGPAPTEWTTIGAVHSSVPASSWNWLQTSDTDFNTGTKDKVVVSGTGTAADLKLATDSSVIVINKQYEFNTSGNTEGWAAGEQVTPLTCDGISLNGQSTDVAPYINGPGSQSIDATNNKIIKIKMKVSDMTTSAKLQFIKSGDTTWNDTKSKTFSYTSTTDWIEYELDMSTISSWSGTVTQLRLYPFTVKDATFNIDYLRVGRPGYSSGSFTSAVYDAGSSLSWGNISWTESLPANTDITLQTRTGAAATPDDTWSAWNTTPYTTPAGEAIASPAGRYIQYRVNMTTTDVGSTPTLSDVTISYSLTSVLEAWATTSLTDGTYAVKLTVTDKSGNTLEVTKTVTLDKAAPTATLDVPGNQGYIRQTVALTGTANDGANFDHYDLTYSGTTSGTIGTHSTPVTSGTLDSWNTTAVTQGSYTIKLYTVDKANNTATATQAVIVDNTAPGISSATPTGTFVPTDANLRVYFSEKMDPSTVTALNNFHARRTADPDTSAYWLAGIYSYTESGTSYYATLDPSALLALDTPYTGTVTTAATDMAGNPLNSNYTWSFTTAGIEGFISSPRAYGRLSGSVAIVGTANGTDAKFSQYKVERKQKDLADIPANWTLIGSVHSTLAERKPTEQTLETWSTTGLNDQYVIRLTITDTSSNSLTSDVLVTIDNTKPTSSFLEIRDTFDSDSGLWTYNARQTVPFDDSGQNVVKNAGTGSSWDANFYRNAYSISNGDITTVEFKVDNASSNFYAAVESYVGVAYYRFGIRHDVSTGKLYVQYMDGATTYEQQLLSSLSLNTWYVLTIKVNDAGNSEIKVYKKGDPAVSGTHSRTIRTGLSWRFRTWVYTGNAYLDNYKEAFINNDYVTGQIKIKGTANDALAGIQKAEIAIQNSGGQYWTGSGNNWQSDPVWISASGSGRSEEGSSNITYSGTWTSENNVSYSGGAVKYASTSGASATFSFSGSSITWISTRASGRGIAKVFIDGSPTEDASIDLSSTTTRYQEPVYTKKWDTVGSHSIKIEATGSRIDLDAFDVGGDAGWSYIWNTASGNFADGTYTFKMRVTDWAGNIQDSPPSISLKVDNTDPTATITSPAANGAGTTSITITGTAKDTPEANFSYYNLHYGAGASPTSWTAIGTNPRTTPVDGGTLGTWDLSSVSEGNYTVRLTVADLAGRSKIVTVYPAIVDKTKPYAEITSPRNMDFVGADITVQGKALDYTSGGVSSGVDAVYLKIIYNVDSFAPTESAWMGVTGTTSWSKSLTIPQGWHGLVAQAIDKAGNSWLSNYVYITIDTEGPPPPVLRGIADRSSGVISLSWTPVKDAGSGVDYFEIKRGGVLVTSGLKYYDGTLMQDIDTTGKFYASNAKDASIDPNATYSYSYQVRAVDYQGNASNWSNSVVVKYDSQSPTQPQSLTANTAGTTNNSYLQWNAATDNLGVAEYRIYRISGSGTPYTGDLKTNLIGTAVTTGTFSTTKFFDGNLVAGQTYSYQVVAFDEALNASPVSNVATATAGTGGTYDLPHVTFSASPEQCVLCHRAHTSQGKNLLGRAYEADLCFTCHDGTASNNPTKAEFDYSPSGGHRLKDDIWPSGAMSCIDCHNPHLNPEAASFENFEDDLSVVPDGWTVGAGSWSGQGNSTAITLTQSAGGTTYITKDTGLDVSQKGGNYAVKVKFTSGTGQAYLTVASDGASARSGVTANLSLTSGKLQLRDGTDIEREVDVSLTSGTWYRIRLKIDSDRLVRLAVYQVIDDTTENKLTEFKDIVPSSYIKGTGSVLELGTVDATAEFDNVKVNDVGMLMTRYRKYYRPGEAPETYKVPDDKLSSEEFCLACHGTSSDSPGGSHRQYYTSIHNPLVGASATPRWQDIRASWKQIKQGSLGSLLKDTNNGCLYCHGYHGQQFYMRTAGGEEELCYRCHGRDANYSRDGWNIYQQYNKTDPDGNPANGPSRHGLTLREATIKCTSCHGQRAMTDRHTYEGAMTSMLTNPFNIKQYWSEMRTGGKTINEYCNSCHQESLPQEKHTATAVVPYSIKYPAMYTTPSANGFVRKGYTENDSEGNPKVGHFAFYPSTGDCSGTCHNTLPDYIKNAPEAKTMINCLTCHHPHATDYERLIRWGEDHKESGTVTKGRCLHCHDGSVTK